MVLLISLYTQLFVLTLLLWFCSFRVLGQDIVRINAPYNPNDMRTNYKMKVLTQALDKTLDTFGPYQIQTIDMSVAVQRAMLEVHSGKHINIYIGVTTEEWEEKTLPVRIPIRRGILSYRLLVTNEAKLTAFSQVSDIDSLRKMLAGVRGGWATTQVFKQHGFTLYEFESLDGLYNMLNRNVLDYIPRGINEAYAEINARQPNSLRVEPNIVLFLPAPTYMFVSPNEGRLAKRLKMGLETMVAEGSLKALFYQFYAENLQAVNFAGRKVITIPNPAAPKSLPFDRPELWFNNDPEWKVD